MTELARRRILVVEDEPHMLDLIRTTLETAGLVVSGATSGAEGLQRLREELPDLVILDLNLPDMTGLEVLSEMRRSGMQCPVIVLTVQDNPEDRVRGLELGADDYIGKPFDHRELVSRIKAVLRRTEMPAPLARNVVRVDEDLTVDFDRRLALVRGEPVHLRPTEYKLLHHLMNNPGKLLSHEALLSRVWGPEYRDDTQLLRLYINYLRKKLERDPAHPRYIINERGLGYRFLNYLAPARSGSQGSAS
ncbi:MAG TPA: response regulator transcription factor [Candidatus Nitrosotenuis sp.]|jgi:two-component system KDP operon response regulator KdpE|nr:response regulator transcription factor [Candidatus Nitrosotenuis sp.]